MRHDRSSLVQEPGSRSRGEADAARYLSAALLLHGPLDRDALLAALDELPQRHAWPSLRSPAADSLVPSAGQAASVIHFEDLAVLDAARRAVRKEHYRSLELQASTQEDQGAILRATLLALPGNVHRLNVTIHRSVCDRAAFGMIIQVLGRLYTSRLRKEEPQAQPWPIPVGAQSPPARWRADNDELAAGLIGQPGPQDHPDAVACLPADRQRVPSRSCRPGSTSLLLGEGFAADLARLCKTVDASELAVHVTAFAVLLARLSDRSNVVISLDASEVSAAGSRLPVGSSEEIFPVSVAVDTDLTGRQLIEAVQAGLDETPTTFAYQLQRPPAVCLRFGQLLTVESVDFLGLKVELRPDQSSAANYEAMLCVTRSPEGLRAEWQYDSNVFDDETIRHWIGCYRTLLKSMVDESDSPIALLEVVTDEQLRLLAAWNETRTDDHHGALVHELVAGHAASVPDRTALRCGSSQVSFGELDLRSNRLAWDLRAQGATRDTRVGIFLEPGIDLAVAHLATLKLGAACVPMDPDLSLADVDRLVNAGHLDLLVSKAALIPLVGRTALRVLLIDEDDERTAGHPETRPPVDVPPTPGDAAYVVFALEAEVEPLGTIFPHRSLINCLESLVSLPGLDEDDRLVIFADREQRRFPLELLAALGIGVEVIIAGRRERTHGPALRALLEDRQATAMHAGPATWHRLIEAGWAGQVAFKAILPATGLTRLLAGQLLLCEAKLWCVHGVAETTWPTGARIGDPNQLPDRDDAAVRTIGRPTPNSLVWILDDHGQGCPVGALGEICIGGEGVGLGYLNNGALTAEKFLPDMRNPRAGRRLVRTGERGRWRHDGSLEHHAGQRSWLEPSMDESPLRTAHSSAHEDIPGDLAAGETMYAVPPSEILEESAARRRFGSPAEAGSKPGHSRAILPLLVLVAVMAWAIYQPIANRTSPARSTEAAALRAGEVPSAPASIEPPSSAGHATEPRPPASASLLHREGPMPHRSETGAEMSSAPAAGATAPDDDCPARSDVLKSCEGTEL